jgi:signal transduction histidine kinase
LELATRICGDVSLEDAKAETLATLRSLLPDCHFEFRSNRAASFDPEPKSEPSQESDSGGPLQSSDDIRGQCEWRLSDVGEGLSLVVSLKQVRQPRELARVLDYAERVVPLLSSAIRRDQTRQRLATLTEELLELRRRVIQADKLASYGQLVASVLHDLNNPLTAILAYAAYLTRTLGSAGITAEDLRRLSRIEEAAQAVLRQTRGLVEYACPPRAPFKRVELAMVIQRALCLCEHEFSRKAVRIHSDLGTHMPTLLGHSEHLTQLFVNLFTNAAQAARDVGAEVHVEVRVNRETGWISVEIRDNGTGIEPTDVAHVFDAFYSTKREHGSGLGLSIVKDIVQHHGGQVTVESTPQIGTTFRVELPLEP